MTKANDKQLAAPGQGATWTPDQVQLITNTVAKGATPDELKLFLYTAQRTGLDPLTKQIHFVKRGTQMTIQTGIDGYRTIAERSGTLAGIDDAIYDSEDGTHPKKASVTVYRMVNGQRVGFTASARWSEYAPQGGQAFMWNKMPYLMLAKCAEALALRKAFPNDLTGLYTNEEMQQADATAVETVPTDTKPPVRAYKNIQENYGPKKVVATQPDDATKIDIKKLCDSLDPTLETKEQYSAFVERQTNMRLEPENYENIKSALQNKLFAKIDAQ